MPIYEYICKSCGERFSLLQKVSATEKDTTCPKCASVEVKKVMSSFCCSGSDAGLLPSSSSRGFSGGG
ncbi:MAG: zinc ribbon domain-containing protein [Nitrospiraceae bacterium]|nr:zinc ribbon domain-containing protein [Nitrospiraceae bacterium]